MHSKISELDEDIKKHSDDLRSYFELLKDTFLERDMKRLYEVHKEQINSIRKMSSSNDLNSPGKLGSTIRPTTTAYATQKTNLINMQHKIPVKLIFTPYQCLLGVLEVLIEIYLMTNSYQY